MNRPFVCRTIRIKWLYRMIRIDGNGVCSHTKGWLNVCRIIGIEWPFVYEQTPLPSVLIILYSHLIIIVLHTKCLFISLYSARPIHHACNGSWFIEVYTCCKYSQNSPRNYSSMLFNHVYIFTNSFFLGKNKPRSCFFPCHRHGNVKTRRCTLKKCCFVDYICFKNGPQPIILALSTINQCYSVHNAIDTH